MKQICYLLLLLSFSAFAKAQEIKVMFGSEKNSAAARKFLDFTFLSDKDKCFQSGSKKEGWYYAGSNGFVGKCVGSLPADTLLEHGVFCQDAALNFPLPNGKYYIRFYLGDWFMGQQRIRIAHDAYVLLDVNGKKLIDRHLSPADIRKNWLKTEEYVFSVHDSIWDRIVKPIVDEVVTEIEVKDGKLTIRAHNIALTALTAFKNKTDSEKHALKVERERRIQFSKRYPWKPKKAEPLPHFGNQEKKQGFLLFQKYGEDIVNPWTRPHESELTTCIKVFAAKGEQEMFRFGIIPLRPLKKFEVQIGDFQGSHGILPLSQNADFYLERYKEYGSQVTSGDCSEMWRLDPRSAVMTTPKPIDCETGTPRMYTLDVRIPQTQPSGDYFAPVTFYENGKIAGKAQLRLKILPFQLETKDAALHSFQQPDMDLFGDYVQGYKNNQKTLEKIVGYIRFQSKYGFSAIHFTGWCGVLHSFYSLGSIKGKDGSRHFVQTKEQASNADYWFRMLRKDGKAEFIAIQFFPLFLLHCKWDPGRGPVLGGQYFGREGDSPELLELKRKDIIQVMKDVETLFKKKADVWPKLCWYVSGEADNFGLEGVKQAVKAAQLVKEANGKSFTVIDGPFGAKLLPPVYDFILANHQAPLSDELAATVRNYGHQLGAHNTGDARFIAGWHFWRTGGFHKYQETGLYTNYVRPYANLPWNYQTAMLLPAPGEGYRPTIYWLNYRDGREDYLYLYTLEQKIKKARQQKKNPKAVVQAEKFLREMHDQIKIDIRYYHLSKVDAKEGSGSIRNDEWNPTSFERLRWNIALLIEELEK